MLQYLAISVLLHEIPSINLCLALSVSSLYIERNKSKCQKKIVKIQSCKFASV